MKHTHYRPYVLALSCAGLFATGASAQDIAFDGGTSNPGIWNDAVNWTGDVLPAPVNGLTDIGVDPTITTAVGAALSATVNLSTNQSIGELRIGRGNSATGVLNHSTGTLSTGGGGWSFIGVDGVTATPSTGTYNLSGTAVFNNTTNDGPVLIGGGGGLGTAGTNSGTVTVADSASWTSNALGVGWNDANTGSLTQTGGSVTVNNWMNVGDSNQGVGTYNMSAGTLSYGELSVGQNSGAVGTMNVSGSSVITGGPARLGRADGSGTLNVTGSGVSISVAQLSLANNDGGFSSNSSGTLNFASDGGGVSAITVAGNVTLNNALGGTNGIANLGVDLSGGDPGGNILLVDVGGTLVGEFTGLAEGAVVPGSNGRTITYVGGDGNDIVLVPEPSAALLALVGGLGLLRRRRS